MARQHYRSTDYHAKSSVGYLVKRSSALLLDTMEPAIADKGFTFTQYIILAWLRDGIAVNAKDICSQFRHDSGALTRVIDQLAERGLLERSRGGRDRRKVDLRLTPLGEKAVEGLIPVVVDRLNVALGDFSTTEVVEFIRLLKKFNTTLQGVLEPTVTSADAAP
jgi:DNA-binding MarR family transcriptional regulator